MLHFFYLAHFSEEASSRKYSDRAKRAKHTSHSAIRKKKKKRLTGITTQSACETEKVCRYQSNSFSHLMRQVLHVLSETF